ncbi:hypothetical protein AURDEDRAFT_166340 [Auricularia subglabra TFB-10046 SS5]|uniref:C2H2-type domain-containing protein n=1 Tax=Auricularia subglabra (strain TFB-10046 / SS5) TaxID=717982 RepID=J0WXN4_AURST|nr:hypothetical protein AURDEDRAFT_166340 [Auricularia subglabra TFB-10046 SS5]
MSPAVGLSCLWSECPEPGLYADSKMLFEHLQAAHNPQSVVLQCKWTGCARDSAITGPQAIAAHLCSHADFRPYVCAYPDCGLAVICAHDLRRHIVDRHDGRAQPRSDSGASPSCLACRWTGCQRMFPNDNTGAGHLWEHVVKKHALRTGPSKELQCRWGPCARAFNNGSHFMPHLRSHLPKWYRPYECTTCSRKFGTAGSLAMHKRTHTPKASAPTRAPAANGEGGGDGRKGKKKRRKVAEDEHSPEFGQLEERVTVLEARLDALITGWRRGRGLPGADESDESEEDD